MVNRRTIVIILAIAVTAVLVYADATSKLFQTEPVIQNPELPDIAVLVQDVPVIESPVEEIVVEQKKEVKKPSKKAKVV